MLLTVIAFLLAISLLVFVHELGHYWVAKRCGVKVLEFSVGFGPAILQRKIGPDQTLWTLAAIPLGGFVKMLDESKPHGPDDPPIDPADLPRAFSRQSVLKRSAIAVAGPIANFLFAILAYAVLNLSGVVEPQARIAQPSPGSVASAAGFEKGDRIVAVGGHRVRSWNQVRLGVMDAAIDRQPARLTIERSGLRRDIDLRTSDIALDDLERDLLLVLGLEMDVKAIRLGELVPEKPAALSGLKKGDQVLAVNGEVLQRASDLFARIQGSPDQELVFTVLRDQTELQIKVTPRAQVDPTKPYANRVGRIGAAILQERFVNQQDTGLMNAFGAAVVQTWDMSVFSLRMLWKMVTGKLSLRHLSGPITIADHAGKAARIGWEAYVAMLALISVSLGVLNLLPIPVLDGGHLVYYALEAIRGKPLSERMMTLTRNLGVVLVGMMMILAISNDILRKLG